MTRRGRRCWAPQPQPGRRLAEGAEPQRPLSCRPICTAARFAPEQHTAFTPSSAACSVALQQPPHSQPRRNAARTCTDESPAAAVIASATACTASSPPTAPASCSAASPKKNSWVVRWAASEWKAEGALQQQAGRQRGEERACEGGRAQVQPARAPAGVATWQNRAEAAQVLLTSQGQPAAWLKQARGRTAAGGW